MVINNLLAKKKMSKNKLSKLSGVPLTTVVDICSGKSDINKCSVETLLKITRVLNTTIESLVSVDNRTAFETFKSQTCHEVKRMGDIPYIIKTIESNEIREYYDMGWYRECYYLLAMLDYLCRVNELLYCAEYYDIRNKALKNTVYPSGTVLRSIVAQSDQPKIDSFANAIPEFRRFNIIESDVRNVC